MTRTHADLDDQGMWHAKNAGACCSAGAYCAFGMISSVHEADGESICTTGTLSHLQWQRSSRRWMSVVQLLFFCYLPDALTYHQVMILCTLTNRCLILTLQVLDRLHLSPPDGIISQNRIHEEGTAYLVADPEVKAPAPRLPAR